MSVERLLWIVVLVIVLAGCIALDLTDAVWDPNPFTTNAISGLVLAALSILLIDEYLSFRAARAWEAVAAFALEDLGRVARAVWVRHASFIQPEYKTMRVEQYRHQLQSAEGRHQQLQRLLEIADDPARRDNLHGVLGETAKRTRELLMQWAPTLVPRAPLAGHLSEVATLHRRIVQVLGLINVGQFGTLPITPQELATKVMDINYLAEDLDRRLFAEAEEIKPLYP